MTVGRSPPHLLAEPTSSRVGIDGEDLDPDHLGEVLDDLEPDGLRVGRVVRAAREQP